MSVRSSYLNKQRTTANRDLISHLLQSVKRGLASNPGLVFFFLVLTVASGNVDCSSTLFLFFDFIVLAQSDDECFLLQALLVSS
jgi:hypothetical protein